MQQRVNLDCTSATLSTSLALTVWDAFPLNKVSQAKRISNKLLLQKKASSKVSPAAIRVLLTPTWALYNDCQSVLCTTEN